MNSAKKVKDSAPTSQNEPNSAQDDIVEQITWDDLFGSEDSVDDHVFNNDDNENDAGSERHDGEDSEEGYGKVESNRNEQEPRLHVESSTFKGEPCAKILMTGNIASQYLDSVTGEFNLETPTESHEVTRLLARVRPRLLEMFPLKVAPHRDDYLSPKYEELDKISFINSGRDWDLPNDVDDFDRLLNRLPVGFARHAIFGLGAKWEYRFIFESIGSIPGIEELVLLKGDETTISPPVYRLGVDAFDSIRKSIDTITRRSQRESHIDRSNLVHNALKHAVDPAAYPEQIKDVKPGALYALVKNSSSKSKRNNADRKAAVEIVKAEVDQLAKTEPANLLSLKESIERATLDGIVGKFEFLMSKKTSEKDWQDFFNTNSFILGLAFAYPVFIVGKEAHVGSATIRGDGAKITDFLFAQRLTGNLAVLEIKTPECEILGKAYRGKPPSVHSVHSMHGNLTGAIAQVLDQRSRLQTEFINIAWTNKWHEFSPHAIHCILIAGITPTTPEGKKSFDLFRHANKDVVIITFDELLMKLKNLQQIMQSWSNDNV